LLCLPAVVIPDHIKILAVDDAERFASVEDLDRSVGSVDFEIGAECSSLRSSACAHTSGCFWPTRGSAQKLAALRPVILVQIFSGTIWPQQE
jgi:hypothetical protein